MSDEEQHGRKLKLARNFGDNKSDFSKLPTLQRLNIGVKFFSKFYKFSLCFYHNFQFYTGHRDLVHLEWVKSSFSCDVPLFLDKKLTVWRVRPRNPPSSSSLGLKGFYCVVS